jgi:acetyl-CoA carboxylase biotin carboxyl carrier protein
MKLDIIAQLVQILKDAPEVGAIEIRRGLFGAWSSVRVSKAGHGVNAGHVVVTQPGATLLPSPVPRPGEGGRGTGEGSVPAPASSLSEIKSPMVGTFYQSPEPGAQAYVKVGSRVNVGQVVCIIEAMKIMNEIESEVAGVVREVAVQNAQPVEFGQVLFRVDPHG